MTSTISPVRGLTKLIDALKFYRDEFKPKINKPMPGASSITFHPSEALLDDCGNRAMEALAAISSPHPTVTDHMWLDPVCDMKGCQSLVLAAALKRLSFAAQTTGGTAGSDAELQAAIEQAAAALASEQPR